MSFMQSINYQGIIKVIVVAVVCYWTAKVSFSLNFGEAEFIPYWPPSGVAFALAILLGWEVWPGVLIGTLLGNIEQWSNPEQSVLTSLSISTFVAIGNVAELLVGIFLLKHWVKVDYPFLRTRDAFRFMFIALIMCLIGALVGLVGQSIYGMLTIAGFLETSFAWWMQSTVGVLVFTPFILAIARKPAFIFSKLILRELIVFIGLMFIVFLLLQPPTIHATVVQGLPYLVLPFILWLSFRFGLAAASTSTLVVSLVVIYFTAHQIGPFVLATSGDSSLLLQLFLGVLSIAMIVLSASVYERMAAQDEVLRVNQNLEDLVLLRTQALNREIETRIAAEQKLQHINQELIKKNSELDNFVYSVSHDLRAPIASIMGLINLLKNDSEITNVKVYLEKMTSSMQQQDNFIQEILDQSRNSRLEVKREEFFFEPLVEETFEQLKFARALNQTIEKIIRIEQRDPFYSDRWRLKIIFNNLIANAIRYYRIPQTVIEITIKVNGPRAFITIKDNGIGIGPEHLTKVFDMFYRATESGAGSGLGLYIVKETVTKLGGRIQLASIPGEGTTIDVQIPAS